MVLFEKKISFSLFGVKFERNLNWNDHVTALASFAAKTLDLSFEQRNSSLPLIYLCFQVRSNPKFCSHMLEAAPPMGLKFEMRGCFFHFNVQSADKFIWSLKMAVECRCFLKLQRPVIRSPDQFVAGWDSAFFSDSGDCFTKSLMCCCFWCSSSTNGVIWSSSLLCNRMPQLFVYRMRALIPWSEQKMHLLERPLFCYLGCL